MTIEAAAQALMFLLKLGFCLCAHGGVPFGCAQSEAAPCGGFPARSLRSLLFGGPRGGEILRLLLLGQFSSSACIPSCTTRKALIDSLYL